MSVKQWAKALFSAVISAAATSALSVATSPEVLASHGWLPVVKIAGGGGFIAALMYLKRSPLPSQGGRLEDE